MFSGFLSVFLCLIVTEYTIFSSYLIVSVTMHQCLMLVYANYFRMFSCFCTFFVNVCVLCFFCYGRPATMGQCLHWQPAIVTVDVYHLCYVLVNKLSLPLCACACKCVHPSRQRLAVNLQFKRLGPRLQYILR